MSSIDIEAAIAAHLSWAKRLRFHIDGISSEQLTVSDVADFRRCVLGQWLYGSGQEYGLFKQYHELLEEHEQFHGIAAKVLQLHQAGLDEAAGAVLDGEFVTASDRVVKLLREIKVEGY